MHQVGQGRVGVVTNCGKFDRILEPGCHILCVNPCVMKLETAQNIHMATQILTCSSDCKTKDNVTLTVTTGIQYRIRRDKVKVAVFDVVQPERQMAAFVDDVLRSTLPTLSLDDAYSSKE
jgi:regulator of protease activity HflC (stomatin/prohibitin superfamily)